MKSELSILETPISLVTEETSASFTSISIEPTSVLEDVIPSTQFSSVSNSSEAQIEEGKTNTPILESSMIESTTSSSVSSSVATPTITTASPETEALGALNETTSTNRLSTTIEPSSGRLFTNDGLYSFD